MIPRNLPRLVTDGIQQGWDVAVEHNFYYRSRRSIRAIFIDPGLDVAFFWDAETGRLIVSEINGTPTPYQQCVALIRSTEEN